MNSYQRVMTALELGQPDQVPVLEWAVCDKVIKALCPIPAKAGMTTLGVVQHPDMSLLPWFNKRWERAVPFDTPSTQVAPPGNLRKGKASTYCGLRS